MGNEVIRHARNDFVCNAATEAAQLEKNRVSMTIWIYLFDNGL